MVGPARGEFRSVLSGLVDFVCDDLESKGQLSQEARHQVISAISEGFNNVIKHAYPNGHSGLLELRILVNSEKLAFSLFDEGPGFDFSKVPVPELDALPEGGMGVYIMKNFMDRVEYTQEENRNMLYLEKLLNVENN